MGSPSDRVWRAGGPVPSAFVPEQIHARPDGSGWLFGWQGGPALEDRIGVILRVDTAGAVRSVWSAPGWVRCGHFHRNVGFAVQALPGPSFTLLRTLDGETWGEVRAIAAPSITAVLAVSPDEAWLLGADVLLRFHKGELGALITPGTGDSTRERLFLAGEQVVLATEAGLFLARDGGLAWGHRPTDGAHVRALQFPYVAATRHRQVVIGRLEPTFVNWLGTVDGEGDPAGLGWAGSALQLALIPAEPATHGGVVLVESRAGGGFATSLLRIPPTASRIGIAGAKGALALAASRELLQAGQP